MSSELSEGWEDGVGRTMEAYRVNQHEARSKVVSHASRVLDALKGKASDVHPDPDDLGQEFASAPSAIPAVGWQAYTPGGSPDDEPFKMSIVGNVGEWYAHTFSNERPSATFNSGFYAGVMAVKAGLVNPDQFKSDSEISFEGQIVFIAEKLHTSGWTTNTLIIDSAARYIQASFALNSSASNATEAEVRAALPLIDEQGEQLPGYEVGTDNDTAKVFLGYNGPFDKSFTRVVKAMVELNEPLSDTQKQ